MAFSLTPRRHLHSLNITAFLLCALSFWPEGARPTTKISAILNQDAFLPCETRRSINIHVYQYQHPVRKEDHINLILWYREGQSMPFYRIDARSTANDLTSATGDYLSAKGGRHYKNDSRIEFDLREVTPLLRIRNVTEEDEGTYQCRVEYASQRTFITQIKLSVIGAPVSLQITDSKGNPLEGVIGPFNEFESITLVCTAYGGRPKPDVIWFKQRGFYEEVVDNSFEFKLLSSPINGTLSTVANVLNLRRLDRTDYHNEYLCRAATRFYYPPLLKSITIDMNLMPVNVRIYSNQYHNSPQSSQLIAGQMAEFGCKTDGSKPAASVEWFLDFQRIVVAKEDPSYHSNYYTDQELHNTTLTSGRVIQVLGEVPPDEQQPQPSGPSLLLSPSSGSIASLSSSTPIPPGKFVSIIGSQEANSTLSVIRFLPQYTDNGRYLSCHAWNPFIANSKIVDKLMLDVKYAPHLTIGLGTKHDILGQWSQSASESVPGVSLTGTSSSSSSISSSSSSSSGTSSSNSPKSLLVGEHSSLLELNCHIKANPWIDQVIWHVNGAPITPTSTSTSAASLEPFYSSAAAAATYSHAQFEAHSKRTSSAALSSQHRPPPGIYLTNHNQTLRLENVARLHAGQYQCAARNLINVTFSEPVQLNVAYKPQCTTINGTAGRPSYHFIDVQRNVPLQLPCSVDAYPADQLTFYWSLQSPWTTEMELELNHTDFEHQNVSVDGSPTVSVLDVDRAVAFFEESEKRRNRTSDTGGESTLLLQCDAENVAGRQEAPCVYMLRIVDGPPQEVSNCTFTVQRASDAKRTTAETQEATAQRTVWGRPTDEGSNEDTLTTDMLTESTRENHSATLQATTEPEQEKPPHQPHSAVPTVLVRCVGGRDGGQAQTFHLIGLISAPTLAETPPVPSGSTALMDRAHESQHQHQHVGNVSSIIELIQSSGSVPMEHTEYSQQQHQQRPPSVHWNVSANEVAQFVLVNVSVGQHYDLIIYAENLIGRSAPLLYRNLLLLNDSVVNQANVATASSRPNWAYLRFKGLVLVLFLVLIMALIGLTIRSYLFPVSNYDRGTHSPDNVSAELNEAETGQLHRQAQHQHYENQMHMSEPQFTGSKVLNNAAEGSGEGRSVSTELQLHHRPASRQISPDRAAPVEQEQASYCSISSGHHQHRPPPPATHFGHLIGAHLCTVKRFLNRFVFISSHYRSYELTPCGEERTVLSVAPASAVPTQEATSTTSALQSSPSGLSHQLLAADSAPTTPGVPPPEVIHSNAEQNRFNWEAAYLRAAALRPSSRPRSKRSRPLFHWLSSSRNYDSYESLPKPDLSSILANDTTEANNESANRNVKLLYIFTRKL